MSHSRSSSSSSNEFGDLFVNEEEEQRQAEAEAERQRVVLIDVPRCRPVATTPTPDAAAAEGPTTSTTTTATTTTTTIDALAPMTLTHRPSCHHSLWGHLLWNASRHIVRMMDDGRIPVKGRSVLELGAGLAAPSLVAASLGARCAVATDFADPVLLDGIADNVARAFLADDAPYRCSDAEIDPSLLGPEVRAAWQRLQAERGFTGKRAESAPSFEVSSAGAVWDKSAPASALHVKGLRWGNGGDIEPVMSLTGFGGFDVVILSDVLFNHPFHDALLATTARCLSRDRNARAYVVFSHHRVLKKADDLAFFDKCSAYGLTWSLDEVNDDYPLMFPDDPGAAEIRKPVYVYTLGLISSSMAPGDLPAHHRVPPLEKFSYDVVLQGTGVVETLVSAACARAGLSVLHLDGAGRYGGALTSVTHKDFKKLFGLEKDAAFGATALPPPVESTQVVAVYPLAEALSRGTNAERGVELQSDADRVLGAHNLAIDLPVMPMLARSHLLDEIAGSQMAESCELGNVHRVLHLSDAPPAPCAIRPVALTRADVFRAGSNVSPMDARRLLRFFGDVMERTAVERDTDDTDVHEADEAVRRWRSKLPEALQAAAATTPFARLVADHYKLSASAIDLITLGGFLVPETTCAEKGVHTLYTYLTSIGKYGGSTPFLMGYYGCSDVAQLFTRMSAVWGGVFALERWATSLVAVKGGRVLPPASAKKAKKADGVAHRAAPDRAAVLPDPESIALPADGDRIILDNGQHLEARCFVTSRASFNAADAEPSAPAQPSAQSVELVRAVFVTKRPVATWELLEAAGDAPRDDEERVLRMQQPEPCAVGFGRWQIEVQTKAGATGSATRAVPVLFSQVGEGTQHAPPHVNVVHVMARRYHDEGAQEVTPAALLAAARARLFIDDSGDDVTAPEPAAAATARPGWARHVLFATAFPWGEAVASRVTGVPLAAPARGDDDDDDFDADETHRAAMERILDGAAAPAASGSGTTEPADAYTAAARERRRVQVVPVQTLFDCLDDGAYAHEAERAFRSVMRRLGRADWRTASFIEQQQQQPEAAPTADATSASS